MSAPLKPGTLCWIVNCVTYPINGRVVEVIGVPPKWVYFSQLLEGEWYEISASWLPDIFPPPQGEHVVARRDILKPMHDPNQDVDVPDKVTLPEKFKTRLDENDRNVHGKEKVS